jgi:hypothetical protein
MTATVLAMLDSGVGTLGRISLNPAQDKIHFSSPLKDFYPKWNPRNKEVLGATFIDLLGMRTGWLTYHFY